MRIGILTYHRADNFGALLQAYALTAYLRSEGHEAEIIDYRCKKIEAQYHVFSPQILFTRKNVFVSLREYLQRFTNVKDRMTRRRKIEAFRKQYIPMSVSLRSIQQPLGYDIIITGSDQVWNFHMNKGSENVYLLDFPMLEHTQRVAYAASSEHNGNGNIGNAYLKYCLKRFGKISVRETFLKEFLQKLVDRDMQVCLDPTFLLPKDQYEKIAQKPMRSKYVLVYHMTYAPEVLPLACKVAKERNAEVVELFGSFMVHNDASHVTVWNPAEVIGYIACAEIIFTTSFHGLALSLILNKDVWVVNKGQNFRQQHLLALAGLSHRMLFDMQDYTEASIDYVRVRARLLPVINSSKAFLHFA